MKHCEEMPIENGRLNADSWPERICVTQKLLDEAIAHGPNPPIKFGTHGTLRFFADDRYAVYQKVEEVLGGWVYRLTESQ